MLNYLSRESSNNCKRSDRLCYKRASANVGISAYSINFSTNHIDTDADKNIIFNMDIGTNHSAHGNITIIANLCIMSY